MTCLQVPWRQSHYPCSLNSKISIKENTVLSSLKDRRGHKSVSLGPQHGSMGNALATQPDVLSSIPRTHMVEGGNQLQVAHTCAVASVCVCINKKLDFILTCLCQGTS